LNHETHETHESKAGEEDRDVAREADGGLRCGVRCIVLAGEHASRLPAWQEGALLSSLDAIKRLHAKVLAGGAA
jgi:monoamine oxidase